MALMQCPECGKEISDQIPACPHCGFPVQKQTDGTGGKNKKKLILPLIIIGSILAIGAVIVICYKFVYKGSFMISQAKDTFELGSDVNLVTYLEYDPENIIEVTVADDGNFNAGKTGDYQVLFRIKNKRGNIKEVPFEFHVTDTVAPELSLLNDTVYIARGSKYNPQDNTEVNDADVCIIETGGDYDLNQEGTYQISLSAKDGSGKISETKTMNLIVENRDDCLFRKVRMGDSAEVVQRYETAELITKQDEDNGESLIVYEDAVEGEDAYIYYQLNDKDQLCCIVVSFIQPHTDYSLYISKFGSITENLNLKYGEAKTEKGKGRLYGYCSSEGEALSIGEVKYRNSWDTEDLSIVLYLGSDNYEITFSIIYDSKTLDHPDGVGLNQ